MNNKVLIKVIVPDLDSSFDMFIPVNEVIWKVKKLVVKTIQDLTNIQPTQTDKFTFINKGNSRIYGNNEIIFNTDIRNSTEIILICQKKSNI